MASLLASGVVIAVSSQAAAQNIADARAVPQQGASLHIARFWRGNGVTLVEGVVGARVGAGSTAQPVVELSIRDDKGQVLHRETWTDTVTQQLLSVARDRSDVEMSTPVRVNVRPGTYTVSAVVKRGEMVDSAVRTVAAFAQQPLISDLIVSNSIRALSDSAAPVGAETQIGRFAVMRTARPALQPTDAGLWYYLELYTPEGATDAKADLDFTVVRTSGGAPLLHTTRSVALNARGGSDAARIPLQGLPPGEYIVRVRAQIGSKVEERSAPFGMMSFSTQAPVQTQSAPAAAGTGEERLYQKYFAPAVRSDSSVAQIIEALTVSSLAEAVPSYVLQLDPEAKRHFLARYFSHVSDPKPDTPEHELLEEYAGRAQYAAREFAERDVGRSGLRTDRGRIYLRYGPPQVKQQLPLGSMSKGAVEVWKYTQRRGLKYAFLDESGFQHYNLVYTTDPNIQSLPDWQARVNDPEVIQTILAF